MAGSLIGGSALGAVFGELLKPVIAEIKNVKSFKSSFKRLESTLESIVPYVEEIKSLHRRLDLPESEMQILIDTIEEARKLARECSSIWRFAPYSKSRYNRKIKKVDEKLVRFCQIQMSFLSGRNQLQTMCSMNCLTERIEGLSLNGNLSLTSSSGSDSGGGSDFMELCSVPEYESRTVGLDLPLKDLKMKLFEDGTSIIVVSAPGGCGKTTLVSKLCRDEEVTRKFKSIFFLTVSEMPDMRVMVGKLFQHCGYRVPSLRTDSETTTHLQQLLQSVGAKNPMLLVLDDAWPGAESLVKKFMVTLPDYKILVTSRFDFPSFGSAFRLKPLNHEDARALFIQWASSRRDGWSHGRDEVFLQKILKLCHGFPLGVKVLSRLSVTQLRSLVMQRSESKSIFDIPDKELLECLQSSVDFLDNVHRECFSDLGLFPEDKKIRASTIIDMWAVLYDLDEDGVDAKSYLENLSDQNLLHLFCVGRDECEVNGFYNEYFVTQHDTLRALAIRQSISEPREARKRLNIEITGNKFPEWLLNLRQPISARLLSISTDESFSSSWFDIKFPEVEVLVLNFTSSHYVLPEFIATMSKLKVLVVTNYGFSPAELINFSVIGSLTNLKRIRLEKVSIASLDMTRLQLMNLEKISFVMCKIREAFHNLPIDINNALPKLVEIEIDYCTDLEELPNWVCEIIELRKLSITNCNKLSKLPRAIGNLMNLEVLRLSSCINLSELPDTIGGLRKLSYLDISDCMSIKRLPPQIGELHGLKKFCIRKCSSRELLMSIKNLGELEVVCDEETELLCEQFVPSLKDSITVRKDEPSLNWLATL